MSDTFDVTVTYDRDPPIYQAGETIRITVAGTNTHTTDETIVTETEEPYDLSVVSDGGVHTTVSVPEHSVQRTTPGTVTVEKVFIDAPPGSVLRLGGKDLTVSGDRTYMTAVA